MRNIALSNFESFSLVGVKNVDAFYTDQDYILLYSQGRILKYQTNDKSLSEICDLKNDLYPVCDEEPPKALDITYSFEKKAIFLILCNGDVVSVEIQYNNKCSSDTVGSVTGGLKAAKWSPDNYIVALVSHDDKVILMTNDFDPVSEVDLHGGGFGEKQFTTVGWGKKETQFRGSEGKYATESSPTTLPKSEVPQDDVIRISWRGDAKYFAVSSLNPDTKERYLRIFNEEGVLQYTSEAVSGLEQSLDWKPSGSLIASTQRLPNKHNVCFFEKNGLKHGDFTLPFTPNEVIVNELMWNEDSKLMALLINKTGSFLSSSSAPEAEENVCQKKGEKIISIYSTSNYHWYCKYFIPFPFDNEIQMKWDRHNSNLLHVIVTTKENCILYNKYTWLSCINKSRGNSLGEDKALVAVIDGSKVLITSFKSGITPPPMCTYSLDMSSQVNQVGFAQNNPNKSSNDMFVYLSNGEICIYKFEHDDGKKPIEMTHTLLGKLQPKTEFLYNIQWVSPKTFAFCERTSHVSDSEYVLNVIDILNFDSTMITYNEKKYPLKSSISLLSSCSDLYILLHDNNGDSYLLERDKDVLTDLYPDQKRALKELQVIETSEKSFVTFGLDKSNKFFINNKIIANNITSFHIHQQFLLLTNLKHRLLCIPIESDIEQMTSKVEMNEISTRKVEKGARIITSVSQDTKVVLQMPRGNLECIQPRALSFSIIGKFLDELNYYEAFNIMRQQRINLNLLYDHDPNSFKENIHTFIEQIKDPAWLSLFLSELVDEDVTKTMYSVIYNKRERNSATEESKVAKICELLENVLENMKNRDQYILPILTTFIKRGETHYIECALSKIKKLKESENSGQQPAVKFDEAFRYMLYLIDVEDLYKVALGMYDFDLVLLVATKSQKDPKEYLPFLNDLRKLDANYQKFVIDKYLKRYEKALKNLLQCGGDDLFTECLTFIKSHKLYKTALKLVPHTTDIYKQICANYADELMKSHLYEEAGIMYSNSGSYSNAIAAFMKSGNWHEVISCSTKLNFTSQELYTNLGGELMEAKKFKEASIIFMDYLQNTEMAVIALCSGKMYIEAFRIAELHNRDDLVQEHIKPNILKSYVHTAMQLSSFGELFKSQKNRLRVVREKKSFIPENAEGGPDANSEQDEFSESSTVVTQSCTGSRTTNRTFRSAKNKRKQERKLLSLKEGSPYEDLALIASLHNIASNCFEMSIEIRELNKSLIKINEVCLAEELQKKFEVLLKDIEDSKTEIWTPDLLSRRPTYGPEATSNSIAASFTQGENSAPTHLINPRLLIPPELQSNIRWKLEILNP